MVPPLSDRATVATESKPDGAAQGEVCEADGPDPEVAPFGRAPLELEEQEPLSTPSGEGADDANLTDGDDLSAAGGAVTVVTAPTTNFAPTAAPPPTATVTVTGADESPVVLVDVTEGAASPVPFDEAAMAAADTETTGAAAVETALAAISISTDINVKETAAREGPQRDDAAVAPPSKPSAADATPAAVVGAPHVFAVKVEAPLSSQAPRQPITTAASKERERTEAVTPPSDRAAIATVPRESKPTSAAQVPNLSMAAAPREVCEADGPDPEVAPLSRAPLEPEEQESLPTPSGKGADDANLTDGDERPAAGGAATVLAVTVPTMNLAPAAAPPLTATVAVTGADESPSVLADAAEGAFCPAPFDEVAIADCTKGDGDPAGDGAGVATVLAVTVPTTNLAPAAAPPTAATVAAVPGADELPVVLTDATEGAVCTAPFGEAAIVDRTDGDGDSVSDGVGMATVLAVMVPTANLAPAVTPPPTATMAVTGADESLVVLADATEEAVCTASFDEAAISAAAAQTTGAAAEEAAPASILISTDINVKETATGEGPRRDDAAVAPPPESPVADAPPAEAACVSHSDTIKLEAPLSSPAPRQPKTTTASIEREPAAAVPPPSDRAAVTPESKPAGAAQVPNLAMAAARREACETDGHGPEVAPLGHAPPELEEQESLSRPSGNEFGDADRADGDECLVACGAATVVTVSTTNLAPVAAPPAEPARAADAAAATLPTAESARMAEAAAVAPLAAEPARAVTNTKTVVLHPPVAESAGAGDAEAAAESRSAAAKKNVTVGDDLNASHLALAAGGDDKWRTEGSE